MAGIRWNWTKPLAIAALLLVGASAACVGQAVQFAGKGSLSGKLTDLHSVPLGGVAVVLRNQGTGAEARTTTERNGTYRFTGLGPGEYTLEAESQALGQAQVGGIIVSEGHESRVQAAVRLDPLLPGPTEAAKPIQSVFAVTEAVPTSVAGTGPAPRPSRPAIEASGPTVQPFGQAALPVPSREMPETESPTANAVLDFESIQPLQLGGRRVPELVREKPRTEVLALTAHLADDPMQALPLSDQSWPAATPPAPQAAPAGAANARPPLTNHVLQEIAVKAADALTIPPSGLPDGIKQNGAGIGPALSAGRSLVLGVAVAVAVRAALDFEPIAPRPARRAAHDSDPVSSAVTTTVSGEQLQALPSGGRRWENFMLDTPTAAAPAGGESQVSLRGTESAAFTVDGANKALAFGSGEGQGRGWPRGRGATLSEAAIREVQTTAGNVEAAEGRAAGGRTRVETRGGSNGLHGQGFLFDRQGAWGARNPFTQQVTETAPATLTTSPVFTPAPYTPPGS